MDQSAGPRTIYTNCPLNPENAEIRLLRVEPAHSPDGALRYVFSKASLNGRAPPFTAVSYCWGQSEPEQIIYVGSTPVKVTETVHDVLREVLAGGAALAWIDQVCIDQRNAAERSSQVAVMGVIYSRADRVLVYLGEAGERTSLAVDFLEHYSRRLKDQYDGETGIVQLSTSESLSLVASNDYGRFSDTPVLRHVALGLADILTRSFFKRLWIVQEVVLATNLMAVCGSRHFSWDLLSLACLLFTRRPEFASVLKSFVHIDCDFTTMRKASRLVKAHGKLINRDLWDLLDECSGLATSEPRDKIYAVLGLAKRTAALPVPDYARSVKEIYLEFARHFVRTGHGLEVITAAVANDHPKKADYPSWAPWFDEMDARHFGRTTARMNAAADTIPMVILGSCTSDIIVQGAILDRVLDVGPSGLRRGEKLVTPSSEHELFLEWIVKSLALLQAHHVAFAAASLASILLQESPKISHESVGSAHSRLVDASKDVLSNTLSAFIESLRTLSGRTGLRSRLMTFRFDQQTSGSGHITLLNDFAFQAIANLQGRRVFVTEQNRIGLASNDTNLGDHIAIISGGRMPYVLREKQKLRPNYTLVTWAYVQGIMHGEALEERKCQFENITIG
jgi:Heterokaryon incompatibility protein (HET)